MRVWPVLGVTAVLATGIAVIVVVSSGDDEVADADEPFVERNLAEVSRRDLIRTEEFDGTAGRGPGEPLVLAASGTLTALPEPGATISSGDAFAEVDGAPIVALAGAFPMWRTLGPGVSDGKDVLQLEYALATLGYAQDHDVTVDDEWTSATTNAVEAFQHDHGQGDDGRVDLGEIVWIEGPVRVDTVAGTVGQQAAQAGIEITLPDQSVLVDVPVADADLLPIGATVDVELPSGEMTVATVTAVGSVETSETGETTLPVAVTLDGGDEMPDGTPVDVRARVVSAEDVLAVPVEAIVALAEGGYALEVVLADGTARLVGVELGVFADGHVEVTGDVNAGDRVVVP